MSDPEPCRCWATTDAWLHGGHCCFLEWPDTTQPMPCHHDTPERVAHLRAITRKANR